MPKLGLAAFVSKYGYWAVLVGTMLEGETFLVLSGIAAQQGLLDFALLVPCGVAGALVSDIAFFVIGWKAGDGIQNRFGRIKPALAQLNRLVERHPRACVIAVRFSYGMRTVGPMLIGAGRLSLIAYVLLDAMAATLWCVCWLTLGAGLSNLLGLNVDGTVTAIRWTMVGAVVCVAGLLIMRSRRRHRSGGNNGL
jgi:membrane protein DedA with SNARE-associated domain